MGRRGGAPTQWRRAVTFNVDFRYPPSDVTRIVQDALRGTGGDGLFYCFAAQ